MTTFSWEEIQKHNTEDDTWVVLHGAVYSVSKYLEDHPGGKDLLLEVAGQDATKFFEEALHSEDARDILPRLKVGNVKEYQRLDGASSPVSILGPQAAEKRESRANIVMSVTAPLAVTTLLGYHRDKLSSIWSAPLQSLTGADPIWFSAVVVLVLSFWGLCMWASYIIYVDYGNLKKFPSRIRIE